jgi:hypothetical protein
MKIVMSGSASDKLDWQKHIRSKKRREELAKAFKVDRLADILQPRCNPFAASPQHRCGTVNLTAI